MGRRLLLALSSALACSASGPPPLDLAPGREGGERSERDRSLEPDLAARDGAARAELPPREAAAVLDGDGDGIADAEEQALAEKYFPYLSLSPSDACPRHGVLYRLAPHPADASKLAVWYVVLYEKDCGALGHVGDDEVFGALLDPKLPPPAGLLALRAISHQGTVCEKKTSCGSLPGCEPCATAARGGQQVPVVFSSLNKHGGYVKESTCDLNVLCDLGGCALASTPSAPPLVNAGEPGKPLVQDLTTQGFINAKNGWSEAALQHYDPWGGKKFGGAGKVSDDLVDAAFVIGPAGCP
jgi:hypothetical protein